MKNSKLSNFNFQFIKLRFLSIQTETISLVFVSSFTNSIKLNVNSLTHRDTNPHRFQTSTNSIDQKLNYESAISK